MNNPLIVDEYLNATGQLCVALRTSLINAPQYVLTREQATALRDELNRALANEFGDDDADDSAACAADHAQDTA